MKVASAVLELLLSAAAELHGAGAHLVVLKGKRPLWRAWQRRRAPLETVFQHLAEGGDVGIRPESLGCMVLDVDDGFALAKKTLMCDAEPVLAAPSATPGRGHIYYAGRVPGVNHRTTFERGEQIHGEVICGGMVRIYDLPGLAGAIRRRGPPKRPPREPAAWLHYYGTQKPPQALKLHATLGPGPGPRPAAAPRADTVRANATAADAKGVREGERNVTLFNWLRQFAFRAVADAPSEDALYTRLERAAFEYENTYTCSREADSDIRATAVSVTRYTWKRRKSFARRRSLSERQRERGRASGESRAEIAARDDDTIRRMTADEKTQREIADAIGRCQSTVHKRMKKMGLIRSSRPRAGAHPPAPARALAHARA